MGSAAPAASACRPFAPRKPFSHASRRLESKRALLNALSRYCAPGWSRFAALGGIGGVGGDFVGDNAVVYVFLVGEAEVFLGSRRKFIYEYDFGDGWQHEVAAEKILPPDPAFKHPLCLAGANACPPEDCGGMGGYYDLLEILANPKYPEHADVKEWIGGGFDPNEFSLDGVNLVLKRLKP